MLKKWTFEWVTKSENERRTRSIYAHSLLLNQI